MNWQENANCQGIDANMFYPDPSDTDTTRAALAVCANCPVREQCLTAAIDRRDTNGVWGGTTEAERRAIIRRLRAANRKPRTPVE